MSHIFKNSGIKGEKRNTYKKVEKRRFAVPQKTNHLQEFLSSLALVRPTTACTTDYMTLEYRNA